MGSELSGGNGSRLLNTSGTFFNCLFKM